VLAIAETKFFVPPHSSVRGNSRVVDGAQTSSNTFLMVRQSSFSNAVVEVPYLVTSIPLILSWRRNIDTKENGLQIQRGSYPTKAE
jgi:hypothetical protein